MSTRMVCGRLLGDDLPTWRGDAGLIDQAGGRRLTYRDPAVGILADWQSTRSALAAGITALGVIAAVVAVRLGWTQVKELKASRQAIVTLDISRRWDETELVECRKLMAGDPEQLRAQVLATGNDPDRDAYYVLTRRLGCGQVDGRWVR